MIGLNQMNVRLFWRNWPFNSATVLVAICFQACHFQSETADQIVHNGVILTLNESNEVAQAIAIRDGRVIDVGPDRYILNKYRASQSVDLKGGVLTPGLMDGHAHLVGYADALLEANLVGTTSWEDAVTKTQAHQRQRPFEWVLGRGWDQNDWPIPEFPHRRELDEAFPDIPVALERIDGHALILNKKALEICGIWEAFENRSGIKVEGGEIILGEDGLPTGLLVDQACELIGPFRPMRKSEDRNQALLEAQDSLLHHGITGITDAGLHPEEILRIEALQASGELKLRVNAMVSASDEHIDWLIERGGIQNERLTVGSVKFYMDGALGSRGALLLQPYSDRMNWSGLITQDLIQFKQQLEKLHEHNFQAATHCIGDSAVRQVLRLYGELLGGVTDRRWRIEHAQVVHGDDLNLFGAFAVIPSVQPTHATSDMYWAGERLGRNRIRRAYAYQDLWKQLQFLTLGTDFPVEDIDPRKTFLASVGRVDANGFPEGGFQKDNALSAEQTLRGMTQGVAIAQFQEQELGTIETGKWADFTWMDRNWLEVESTRILDTRMMGTCIAGEWVYLKAGQ